MALLKELEKKDSLKFKAEEGQLLTEAVSPGSKRVLNYANGVRKNNIGSLYSKKRDQMLTGGRRKSMTA